MSSVTPAALRAAVLSSLSAHTDPRVAKIANEGVLSIEHAVSEWEASTGRVVAHRVRVGLTAALLGMVRGHPHVEDEVTRVVSIAMAQKHGDRVSEVVFHYDPVAAAHLVVESPYRGSLVPPEPPAPRASASPDLAADAADYLTAFGEPDGAAVAGRARMQLTSAGTVRVELDAEDAAARPEHLALLEKCLRDLLEGPSRTRVRCVILRGRHAR
jgi:hypothetical protein